MSQNQQDQTAEHGTDQAAPATSLPLALGRIGTWTMLPDWVALSGISPRAQALYWQLALHLNRRRGDRVVFPSRRSLATRLGFTQPRTIDRYLAELINVGAIDKNTVRTSRMRSRNLYVLHREPHPGYRGPRSLADIAKAAPNHAPDSQVSHREAEPDQHEPTREPTQNARTRPTEVREHAPRLGAYAHPNQKNLNQKNHHLHRRVNTTEARLDTSVRNTPDRADRVVVEEEAEHFLRTLPAHVNLSEGTIRQGIPQVARALESGWPGDQLRTVLTRDLGSARNIPGVIIHRLQTLPPPPLPSAVTHHPAAASRSCSDHPGTARRSDGECAGCWADKQHRR